MLSPFEHHRQKETERNKHYDISDQESFLCSVFVPSGEKTPVDSAVVCHWSVKQGQMKDTICIDNKKKTAV